VRPRRLGFMKHRLRQAAAPCQNQMSCKIATGQSVDLARDTEPLGKAVEDRRAVLDTS